MWAYRARDAVATAMHGMWGSFWLAYGLLQLLVVTGVLAAGGTLDHALGFWFIALCAITFSGMLGALAEGNLGVTAVLGVLAAGAGCRSSRQTGSRTHPAPSRLGRSSSSGVSRA